MEQVSSYVDAVCEGGGIGRRTFLNDRDVSLCGNHLEIESVSMKALKSRAIR